MRAAFVAGAAAGAELSTAGAPAVWRASTWSADPALARAKAMAVDDHNRVFVSESERSPDRGVFSVDGRADRIADDAALETVPQRVAAIRRWRDREDWPDEAAPPASPATGGGFLRKFSESVSLFDDTDGDGRAERRRVFASAFNDEADGPAGGLLCSESNVYFMCAPHLWMLRDFDRDDRANDRLVVLAGLGVRVGDPTHSAGPIVAGPDGRLYLAVGDRGSNIHAAAAGQNHYHPTKGVIIRCWPDGTGIETFATGMRAPEGLAFDQSGRLFAVDGDLQFIPEGFDGGWEATLADQPDALRTWRDDHPAWRLPSAGADSGGLVDLCADPGAAGPRDARSTILAADGRSIRRLQFEPIGGGWRLRENEFMGAVPGAARLTVTPSGSLLVLTRGSPAELVRLDPPEEAGTAEREAAAFLRAGFRHRRVDELIPLLGHRDGRIRARAQSAIVEKGWRDSLAALAGIAIGGADTMSRLHALWAAGQFARDNPLLLAAFSGSLGADQPQVRMVAATVLGDGRCVDAGRRMLDLLNDSSREVRAAAARAVGKLSPPGARTGLLDLAQSDDDVFVRHAVAFGLAKLGAEELSLSARDRTEPAARLAAVLALRRLESPACASFLSDPDPAVAAEAACAIYDCEIEPALPALAERLGDEIPFSARPMVVWRRVLAANHRSGTTADAQRVAAFAARAKADVSEPLRAEALAALASWDNPPAREPIWGRHRPVPPRDAARAWPALAEHLPAIIRNAAGPSQALARRLQAQVLALPSSSAPRGDWFADDTVPEGVRLFALRETNSRSAEDLATLEAACRAALRSRAPKLRAEARSLLIRRTPALAVDLVNEALSGGSILEKQAAVGALDGLRGPESIRLVVALLARLATASGDLSFAPELLEVASKLERVEPGNGRAIREALENVRTAWRAHADRLRPWRAAQDGGDPPAGRALFVSDLGRCTRCHAINGRGGGSAPDLAGVSSRFSPAGLLESVVLPSSRIASGYRHVTATRHDGSTVSGFLDTSTANAITVRTETTPVTWLRSEVKEISPPASPCRPMGTLLTLRELRDLVAYLRTLE